jgi:hypothetical protein
MKNKTLLLIIALSLVVQPSFGAFPAKHPATTNVPENTTGPANDYGSGSASQLSTKLAPIVHAFDGKHHGHESDNNTQGRLSMVFGIAALATFVVGGGFLFGIPSIILGVIGLRRHQTHSRAGVIMGGIAFVLSIIAAFVWLLVFLSTPA